jgi:flagellar protein FliO/FliZ
MKVTTRVCKIFISRAQLILIFSLCTSFSVVAEVNTQTSVQDSAPLAQPNSVIQDPAPVTAATSPVNSPKTTPPEVTKASSSSQLASLLGGLALIVALIYGLSWFAKRFSQGGFLQNSTIKMISTMPLGTRERLMLVDVGGKQILLGITATSISSLHVFDTPVVTESDTHVKTSSDFSQKLMALLQQKAPTAGDSAGQKNENQ